MSQHSARGPAYERLREWAKANLPWVCWICHLPIEPWVLPKTAMSWSLDHVIPVSRGGNRLDPANARPAHLRCNASRGDRVHQPRLPVPAPSRDW